VVSAPADRRLLLETRDDALSVLRRTGERLDALTELAALAEATRDPDFELDVRLRRASALRMSHDEETAAELARRVADRAAERGDAAMELRAMLELGQAILGSPLGESFGGDAVDTNFDGAEAGLPPGGRARGAAGRRTQPRRRPPRDRDDRLRPRQGLVGG
jgi:hypothetical protein